MARPITETPVLKGNDAALFLETMKASESIRISNQERERIKASFENINSLLKGK